MTTKNSEFKDPPDALEPVYTTPQANSRILLREGIVQLHGNNDRLSGRGTIYLDWSPSPRVCFELSLDEGARIDLGPVKLEFLEEWPNEVVNADVRSTSLWSTQNSTPASGVIEEWKRNPDAAVKDIIFHVPNFRDYRGEPIRNARSVWGGRAALHFDKWKIEIDSIRQAGLHKDLEATGGFGMTHVGCLSHQDGSLFAPADAENCLGWFLSFCNGRWTAPILSQGCDQDSKFVSHEWKIPRISPYRGVRSWFSDLRRNVLSDLYPGFADRWSNETWSSTLRIAIYWYILGNAPGVAIENGVILAHVAFESLGWTLFVEDTKCLSPEGYERMRAADKLRLLLNQCRIPLDVPSELASLRQSAKAVNWNDGPGSLAAVRNSYVHPSIKNRDRLSRAGPEAEYQAWVVSMYYLELLLLYLCNYQGEFSSRLIGGVFAGQEINTVPWAS
jgi:hypothetical protein